MSPSPRPYRETTDERAHRQAACFRRLAEMGMTAAELAHTRLQAADAAGEDTGKPTLDLARAARAVTAAIRAENDLFRNKAAPRASAADPRRAPIRDALHKVANREPNPTTRNEMRREIDAALEEALVADPDATIAVDVLLFDLADRLHIQLDIAKLPDALIGMPPRKYPRDGPHGGAPGERFG